MGVERALVSSGGLCVLRSNHQLARRDTSVHALANRVEVVALSDFRTLIDIHGGDYITVECTDGVTIQVAIGTGAPLRVSSDIIMSRIVPRLRERMRAMLEDGFKKFDIRFGNTSIAVNYYDAGLVLDALVGCVRYIK